MREGVLLKLEFVSERVSREEGCQEEPDRQTAI